MRLDRYLAKALPLLPASLAQKYIRIKRIKRNGARAQRDDRLEEGDLLQLYINDEFFDRPRADNAYLTVTSPKLHLIYEDAHLLLVDKQPGLAVHPHDGAEYGKTLIDHIQAYLYAKGDWRPRQSTFVPALCNRIDRNTGGIVIAAKSAEALRILNQKVRDRELDKRYLAVIEGRMHPPEGTLRGQIFKAPARLENRLNSLPHTPGPKWSVAGGMSVGNRPHPSDPRTIRPRRTSPSRRRKVRKAGQGPPAPLPSPVRLPIDFSIHHRRRLSILFKRANISGGGGPLCPGIFSRK